MAGKRSWVQCPETGKLIPKEEYVQPERYKGLYVYGDLPEYTAIAGDMAYKPIDGRKQHREFLKRNGLQEAGDMKLSDIKKYNGMTQENWETQRRKEKRAKDFLKYTSPRWMDANVRDRD